DSSIILPNHLPDQLLNHLRVASATPYEKELLSLSELERDAILSAAQEFRGNLSQMAKQLGLSRTTIWRKMKMMDLSPEEFRASAPYRSTVPS
ncbi:MAG TPA: helix-turn-helix domain-containing protein, partial [Anaerolineales bacterium]|nr:helix-turn-helix domain-containing protein [Anaerolineales bacterium]